MFVIEYFRFFISWNFLQCNNAQNEIRPMLMNRSSYSYKIYFIIFGHVYKFLLIFKDGNDFYQLNQLEMEFKRPHSAGVDFGPRPGDTSLAQRSKWPSRPGRAARWALWRWSPRWAAAVAREYQARRRNRCSGATSLSMRWRRRAHLARRVATFQWRWQLVVVGGGHSSS
jgi:hypothetical protein